MALTDAFDFGEDRISHNYIEVGSNISIGAYTCLTGQDSTIRIGNASIGDTVKLKVAVNVGADSVVLAFIQPWHGGANAPQVVADNNAVGNVPYTSLGNCSYGNLYLTNQSANTADGFLNLMIINGAASFDQDGQIAFLNVYSNNSTVGINDPRSKPITIFLNGSEIEFTNITPSSSVFIYDATGKVYATKTISGSDSKISVEQLPVGIYFYRIEGALSNSTGKFMIGK